MSPSYREIKYLDSPEYKKLISRFPNITVTKQLDPELLSINCSPSHINKAIMNLITNSIEAIEGTGNVHVSTSNFTLDTMLQGYDDIQTGRYILFTVSDDGPGILSDDLDRIFEPFYSKKVMGRSGTGLGLAVVWNTVQDHDGYINVASNESGTTFELFLPASNLLPDEVEDMVSHRELKGKGEKILVIDDEPNQRIITKTLLKRLGYNITTVPSGEEAINYLQDHTVDLLILDMIMTPEMNGRQTYEQIIKLHPHQKAIISSGYAEDKEVKMAKKLGAGQYLKKPFTLEQLGIAVREELQK